MQLDHRKSRAKPQRQPQLYDDTSQQPGYPGPGPQYDYNAGAYGGGAPQPQQAPNFPLNFPGQQYLNDPMANVAVQYGQTLADQGKNYVHRHIDQYVSTSKLKYYFAVDTAYVGKKIGLVLFPFAHKDWSIRYNQDEPVAPRHEVNAPDLYIPVMAFVTYILLAGAILGTQNRFSPESLGMIASSATVWMVIEIVALLMSMYILQVSTDLKYIDLLAYCGYKYVGMNGAILAGALFVSTGYYTVLFWCSLSLAFFLVRSLKMAVIPHNDPDSFSKGNKRRLYMLLVLALSQPVFMWWLTRYVVFV